jgi:hypothetical protein
LVLAAQLTSPDRIHLVFLGYFPLVSGSWFVSSQSIPWCEMVHRMSFSVSRIIPMDLASSSRNSSTVLAVHVHVST